MEEQPKPGTTPGLARRAANPPPPVADQLAELQAQVLALRALVEAMLVRPDMRWIKDELTKRSNAMVTAVADRSPIPTRPAVKARAKNILHLELALLPGAGSPPGTPRP